MRLSKRCEYGIKAAIRLSVYGGRGYLQAREIAAAEHLPAKFLESILLALRSAKLLESKVGAGGGYRLARAASQISVMDLIRTLDGGPAGGDVSDTPTPGAVGLAAVHQRLDESLENAVGELTLADLATITETSLTPSR